MRVLTILFFLIIIPVMAFGGDVVFTNLPAHLQLFPRDAQDSAVVAVSGRVETPGYQQVSLEVYKNADLWKSLAQSLDYQGNTADFSFEPKIHAELSEYFFYVYLDDSLIARIDSIVCGDVYLINGQSNSHPNAATYSFRSEFCRSFGRHTNYNDYDPADTTWGLSTGEGWCDSCLYAVGTWGLRLQELMLNEYGMPTCVINGGSGGSSISYNLPNEDDHMDLTTTYGRLLYRATKAHVQDAVKALFWHQGESDSSPPDDSLYFDRFSQLRQAWREDYAPLDKIYVFQIHPGYCGGDGQSYLRNVQRNFKQHFPEVEVMATVGLDGHDGCHYNDDGYLQMAQWIYRLVRRDFYGATDTTDVEAPDILSVYYTDDTHTQIAIDYDQPVVWPNDTLNASMKDYFYLDGDFGYIKTGYTINDGYTVILELNTSLIFSVLTYLPNSSYNRVPTKYYEGPFIRNTRGVGALSFHEVPIGSGPSAIHRTVPLSWKLEQNYPNPFGADHSLQGQAMTVIRYQLPVSGQVRLTVYNTLGQVVRRLVNKRQPKGVHRVTFAAGDLPSGLYFYRLEMKDKVLTRKMLIVR